MMHHKITAKFNAIQLFTCSNVHAHKHVHVHVCVCMRRRECFNFSGISFGKYNFDQICHIQDV